MAEAFMKKVAKERSLDIEVCSSGTFAENGAFASYNAIEAMKIYMAENDYQCDLSDTRRHHEIYISDPRKIDVSKMKTIIRYPVRKD